MAATPFHSLEDYIALPRVEALALSPDGSRVVLTVAVLKKDGTAYERSLWAVPADGSGTPKRLTQVRQGRGGRRLHRRAATCCSSRRAPTRMRDADDESGQLWLLPAGGGEARPVTRLAGGVGARSPPPPRPVTAWSSALSCCPGPTRSKPRRSCAKLRKDKKVSAILHDAYPVRFWDHDLGPAEPHLLAIDAGRARGHHRGGGRRRRLPPRRMPLPSRMRPRRHRIRRCGRCRRRRHAIPARRFPAPAT